MSDTIIKSFSAWFTYLAEQLSLDGVFIFGVLLITLAFVALVSYKFASFDYDLLSCSKNVTKFMRLPKSKRLYGSLNYYMRCFPDAIAKTWEKYFIERTGKPSEFLSKSNLSNFGVMEAGIKPIISLVVAFSTLMNLLFALQYKQLPLTSTLIFPILTLAVGIVEIIALNIIFNVVKRVSQKRYSEMLRLLDFHSLNDFASFLSPKITKTKMVAKQEDSLPTRFEMEKVKSKDVETVNQEASASTLEKDITPSQLENLAVSLTLAKTDKNADENTLNNAIENLMKTIAVDDCKQAE